MKYRILENSEGHFAIQYQHKYWPFWFWLTIENAPSDIPTVMIFKTVDVALDYIKVQREEREKPKWKVVWP